MIRRLLIALAFVTLPSAAYAQFPSTNIRLPAFVIPASGVNGGGTVTSPQLLLPDGTAAAPALSWASEPTMGLFRGGTSLLDVSTGSGARVRFDGAAGAVALRSDWSIGWTSGVVSAALDTIVAREAADHTFQKRTTNAQRASWAMTYTSATNYTSVSIDAGQTTANVGIVGCRTAATGTGRSCRFASQADNAGTISYLEIGPTGSTTLTGAFTSYNGVAAAGQGMTVVRAQATTGSVVNTGTASIATWTPGAADVEVEVGCRVNITVSTTHSFSCDVTYTDVSNAARTRVLEMFPLTGTPLTSGLMTNAIGVGDFGSAVIRIGVKASTAIVVRTSAGGTFTTVTYTASGTIKQVG